MKSALLTLMLIFAGAAIHAQDLSALLSQLPAANAAAADANSAALISGGAAQVQAIAGRLKPAGDNTDQPARYALGNLSKYVTRPGAPTEERGAFNAAIVASLANAPDDDARALLMQLLQLTGDDSCVPALAPYLSNARLAPDARLALQAIGGAAAEAALREGAPAPADYPHNTAVMEVPPAAEAFAQRLDAAEDGAKWDVLREGLKSEFTGTRQAALYAAAKGFEGNIQTRKIARLAEEAPPEWMPEYLTMIGKRGGEAAIRVLQEHGKDDSEANRKAALLGLALMNTPEADAAVQEWLAEAEAGAPYAEAQDWLRAIKGAERLLPQPDADGFIPIFNGQNLDDWTGWTRGYEVAEGAIVCKRGGGLNLYHKREFGNFALRFEFKLTPGANNGIGIRAPLKGKASEEGMEIQVLDDGDPKYATGLHDYQVHGSIYGLVPAKRGFLKPVGEWNEQEIRAEGTHITVTLNGNVIVDADLAEVLKQPTLDGKVHTGATRARGHIGFLGHGDVVSYRNLRVKEL